MSEPGRAGADTQTAREQPSWVAWPHMGTGYQGMGDITHHRPLKIGMDMWVVLAGKTWADF